MATAKIRTGMADCIIAGGTESMSMVPTAGWKTVPAYSIAKDEPDFYLSMGLTAEAVANEYKVSREDQDAFALASHQKAKQAIDNGHFKKGILRLDTCTTCLVCCCTLPKCIMMSFSRAYSVFSSTGAFISCLTATEEWDLRTLDCFGIGSLSSLDYSCFIFLFVGFEIVAFTSIRCSSLILKPGFSNKVFS
jgi:hypothetical protein